MKSSTARRISQVAENCLIVGIDPHKRKHAAAMMTRDARVWSRIVVENSQEGFEELCRRASAEANRAEAREIVFAVEAGSHYWRNLGYYLHEQGLTFRLISPLTLKRRREGDDLTRRKNDYRDATMAAELLRTGQYTETVLPEGEYAQLRSLWGWYCRLRKDKTAKTNLLRCQLDGLFPEFCLAFGDPCGLTALAVLTTCANPAVIAAMTEGQFIGRVRAASGAARLAVGKLRKLHALASTSVGVTAGVEAVVAVVADIVWQLRLMRGQLQDVEERLRQTLYQIEESRYVLSIRGLGVLTAAGLMAEIGPVERYRNAKALVKLAGIDPSVSESAGKTKGHGAMSKKGRAKLRCCLWQAVVSLVRHNTAFRQWAECRQERDKDPMKRRRALGALMNKLLRLFYALMTKRQMYDPLKNGEVLKAVA